MHTTFAVLETTDVSHDDLVAMIAAAQAQLVEDYAPEWEKLPAAVVLWPVANAIPTATDKERTVPCAVRASTPDDDPDAVAFHWVNPDSKRVEVVALTDRVTQVAQEEGISFLDALTTAFTHEVIETEGDEFADDWTDVGNGTEQPKELCDRVQSTTYAKTVVDSNGNSKSVQVTNFLLPEAFDDTPADGAKFDFLGKLAHPFDVANGGYTGSRTAGSDETTIQGSKKNALRYSHKSMERRGVDLDSIREPA